MRIPALLVMVALALAGCGGGDAAAPGARSGTTTLATTTTTTATTPARRGTTIVLRSSPFGKMLFDVRRQAIYIFENDPRNRSVCHGRCADAWPPVLTRGEPRAGQGVRASLLGAVKRRDGRRQVTYAGRPLYYYAHEAPGEVRCHNVDLNGGLWWVVGRNGQRRP